MYIYVYVCVCMYICRSVQYVCMGIRVCVRIMDVLKHTHT